MLWPLSVAVDLSPEARNCGPQVVLGVFLARVVIIDDSLLIRRLLREILTEAGHEVVGEAEDGFERRWSFASCAPTWSCSIWSCRGEAE